MYIFQAHPNVLGGHPWLYLIVSFLLVAVAVRIFLYFFLNRLFHSLKVRTVGWHRLEGIEWEGEVKGQRATIAVRRIGWVFGRRCSGPNAWLGVRIEGVRAHIPKASLARPSETDTQDNGAVKSGLQPHVSSFLHQLLHLSATLRSTFHVILRRSVHWLPRPLTRRLVRSFRFMRYRLVRPTLARLNTFGRSMSFLIAYFVIDISDVHIEVEEITRVRASVRVGLELLRGSDSRAGAWLRLAGVAVEEWRPCLDSGSATKTDDTPLVFALPDPITVSANAPFDPAIGLAGLYKRNKDRQIDIRQGIIDVSVNFPFSDGSTSREAVYLRLDALERLMLVFRTMQPRSAAPSPQTPPSSSPRQKRARYVSALRRVSCSLPPIRIAYLHRPSSDADDNDQKPKTLQAPVTVVARAEGLGVDVEFNCTSKTDDRHVGWFGKDRKLKVRARAGWKNWQIGFDVANLRGQFTTCDCCSKHNWLTH
jgi:hypothetical protein